LKYAAEMKQTLGQNSRPIYNYAMRGVVTCFTGIRKKDELVSRSGVQSTLLYIS